jgi:hypothetical protein
MIKPISEKPCGSVEIDLNGPDGNAFMLMGYAEKFGKQIGLDKEQIEAIISDMTSSDYENLIQVFDDNFGEFVILYR